MRTPLVGFALGLPIRGDPRKDASGRVHDVGTADAMRTSTDDQTDNRKDFDEAVNMAPKELEDWLETDESKDAGWGEGESVGHRSGRRIVEIKRKTNDELTDDDYAHMKKVVGYVNRHLAQRPSGDVEDST